MDAGAIRERSLRPTTADSTRSRNAQPSWAAKLIVIDPLVFCWGGSEIDRAHVGDFVLRLRHMADKLQAAVLLVSHPAKGSAGADHDAGEYPSGSSTWYDGPRAVWRLAPERMPSSNGGADDGEKGLALTLTKSNDGGAGARVFVEAEGPSWPLYTATRPYVKHDAKPGAANGAAGANGATPRLRV